MKISAPPWVTQSTKSAVNAIDVMQLALSELAEGNLTAQIATALSGEFDSLRQNFNMASDKLNAVMMGVVEHAATIQNETSEISQASDNLSRRTEQQAATLEETAAAIDQLTASVRSASELSALASKMVADAKQSAEKSGVVVRDAVKGFNTLVASCYCRAGKPPIPDVLLSRAAAILRGSAAPARHFPPAALLARKRAAVASPL
jgi:methyl-accepting chemotaxis protein